MQATIIPKELPSKSVADTPKKVFSCPEYEKFKRLDFSGALPVSKVPHLLKLQTAV